eukprot:gene11808-8119_t
MRPLGFFFCFVCLFALHQAKQDLTEPLEKTKIDDERKMGVEGYVLQNSVRSHELHIYIYIYDAAGPRDLDGKRDWKWRKKKSVLKTRLTFSVNPHKKQTYMVPIQPWLYLAAVLPRQLVHMVVWEISCSFRSGPHDATRISPTQTTTEDNNNNNNNTSTTRKCLELSLSLCVRPGGKGNLGRSARTPQQRIVGKKHAEGTTAYTQQKKSSTAPTPSVGVGADPAAVPRNGRGTTMEIRRSQMPPLLLLLLAFLSVNRTSSTATSRRRTASPAAGRMMLGLAPTAGSACSAAEQSAGGEAALWEREKLLFVSRSDGLSLPPSPHADSCFPEAEHPSLGHVSSLQVPLVVAPAPVGEIIILLDASPSSLERHSPVGKLQPQPQPLDSETGSANSDSNSRTSPQLIEWIGAGTARLSPIGYAEYTKML